MNTFAIHPDTPFSLAAAASFGFGPHTGRPVPEGGVMRLAFVTDDLRHQVGVLLGQGTDGVVHAQVHGGSGSVDVAAQVRRVLSLDRPGQDWLDIGVRDRVIGRLQAGFPGLRPVLFHSPYEAAAWSVLALRRHRTQAAAIRTRLAETHGQRIDIDGQQVAAFPLPEQLLRLDTFPGLDTVRVARLHAVAEAALAGRLDAERLRAMDADDALRELQTIPGLGPTYSQLVLLRATGVTDVMTYHEPRAPYYAAHFYDLDNAPASREQLRELSAGWRPFRTWACVLLRLAGDRANLATGSAGPAMSVRHQK